MTDPTPAASDDPPMWCICKHPRKHHDRVTGCVHCQCPRFTAEPAASDDLFTDDDVDAVLAIIDTDPIGPPTPGCDNCDLMRQECIRCEVRRALSAVAESIAARAKEAGKAEAIPHAYRQGQRDALRQAADDLEAAGGDYYSAQTEAWLRARADALTEGETE